MVKFCVGVCMCTASVKYFIEIKCYFIQCCLFCTFVLNTFYHNSITELLSPIHTRKILTFSGTTVF